MTKQAASAETAPVAGPSSEAPIDTGWNGMGGDAFDGGSLPPSFPPATERIASPVDMAGGGSAQSASSPETASADPSADGSTGYEDKGRQIIAGATERVKTGSEKLFGRAKAGIKGIAGKLVRLARGGAKTVGETAGKGASVAVGFAAIEGPKAAKATAEKASKAIGESARKIHKLAEDARSRREERRNKREAAKTRRGQEYVKRQQARKRALGEIATHNQEIKDDSDERSTDIETDKAKISKQKDALEVKEEEVRAAESRVRKAKRRLERLKTKKEKAVARRNEAQTIRDNNPDDIDATIALKRAEGDLRAIEEQYNAESTIKTSLEGEKVDRSSELGTIRTGLGELQNKVADAKRDNNDGRVKRLENAGASAFLKVAEFVDGSTAAHDLLRRAGRAIRLKFQGGNRQEAKTSA